MKICPNCGTQSPDQALFCGECGFAFSQTPLAQPEVAPDAQPQTAMQYGDAGQAAQDAYAQQPQYDQQQYNQQYNQQYDPNGAQGYYGYGYGVPEEPKKSKKPLIVGLAVGGVALLALIIFFVVRAFAGRGAGHADDDFVGVQQDFLTERLFNPAETVAQDHFSSDITISAAIEGSGDVANILSETLDGSAIVIKAESEKDDLLLDLVLNLKGSNVLEGFFTMTPDQIGFAIPNVDDKYYVAQMDSFLNMLGIDKSTLDRYVSMDTEAYAKNVEASFLRYLDVVRKHVSAESLEIEKDASLKLEVLGENVTATVMTWKPTEEELKALLNEIADTMEKDEALIELLEQTDSVFSLDYSGSVSGILLDAAEQIRDNADEVAKGLADGEFTWKVAANAKGGLCLLSVDVGGDVVGYERVVSDREGKETFYGKTGVSTEFEISNDYTADGTNRAGKLTINTTSGRVSLDYEADTGRRSAIGIPYGTYTLDTRNLGINMDISLTVESGAGASTDHVFLIDGLGMLTDRELTQVRVTINTTDKSTATKPDGKETDISDYTESEVEELLYGLLQEAVMSLMNTPEMLDIMRLFYY